MGLPGAYFDPAAGEPEKLSVDRHRRLRDVKYQEVANLVRFVDGFTPFATQHSVKGAEFENVLIVFGGGWNHYNWPRMLEYMDTGAKPTAAHQKGFNRARNLFYVSVSRPKRRLAVLFTQTMSEKSLGVLNMLFDNKVAAVNRNIAVRRSLEAQSPQRPISRLCSLSARRPLQTISATQPNFHFGHIPDHQTYSRPPY